MSGISSPVSQYQSRKAASRRWRAPSFDIQSGFLSQRGGPCRQLRREPKTVPHSGHSNSTPTSFGSHWQNSAVSSARRPASVMTYPHVTGYCSVARTATSTECESSLICIEIVTRRPGYTLFPPVASGCSLRRSRRSVTPTVLQRRTGGRGVLPFQEAFMCAACTFPWGSAPNPVRESLAELGTRLPLVLEQLSLTDAATPYIGAGRRAVGAAGVADRRA